MEPWICETEAADLGPATDRGCNAPPKVEFFYKSSDSTKAGFQRYDITNPPDDVATTRTDHGKTVPFIVRRETGTANRGVYSIAVLHDAAQPLSPWTQPIAWNGKLHYLFQGGGAPNYRQGSDPYSVMTADAQGTVNDSIVYQSEFALSRGWVTATATLNRLGQNINTITSAETVMMVKERIIEQFGEIRYTMSTGCSGGGIQQVLIADAYPGLLDGIMPSCTQMDVLTTINNEGLDCSLLVRYFDQTSPLLWATVAQRAAVSGHPSVGTCAQWVDLGTDHTTVDPQVGCMTGNPNVNNTNQALEPDWVYHPQENPDGARCTVQDYMRAVFGRREHTLWGAQERSIGRGFANRPYDNIGVQYGLAALESGLITPEQFVDLNEKIGGYDIDMNWQHQRHSAEPFGLDAAYQTGQVTHGSQLARVPIINLRAEDNNGVHPSVRDWSMRARLVAANGHHDNQLIWNEARPVFPGPAMTQDALLLMDTWLAAIEADHSASPLADKVRAHRPVSATDACWIEDRKITDQATCRAAFPYFGDPRIAAGGPLTDDILKCQVKPMSRQDYRASFTDQQWTRLQRTFASGVCDWSRRGVGQQPSIPWLSFTSGPGGQPLDPAPTSTAVSGNR